MLFAIFVVSKFAPKARLIADVDVDVKEKLSEIAKYHNCSMKDFIEKAVRVEYVKLGLHEKQTN